MHYRYDYTEASGWSFRRIEGGSNELLARLRHASRLGIDPSPRDFPREASVVGLEACLDGWLIWHRPQGEFALDIHFLTDAEAVNPNPFSLLRKRRALPDIETEEFEWSALGALPSETDRPIDIAPDLVYLGAAERLFELEAARRSRSIRYYSSVTRTDQRDSAYAVGAWFRFDAATGIHRPVELWRRLLSSAPQGDTIQEEESEPLAGPMLASPRAPPALEGQLAETGVRRRDRAEDIEEVLREMARLREQFLAESTATDFVRRIEALEVAMSVRPAPPAGTYPPTPKVSGVSLGPAATAGRSRMALAIPLFLIVALVSVVAWTQVQVRALASRIGEIVPYDRLESLEEEVRRRALTSDLDRRLEGLVPMATLELLRAEQAEFATISELSQLRADVAKAAPTADVGRLEQRLSAVEDRVARLEKAVGEGARPRPGVAREPSSGSSSTEGEGK